LTATISTSASTPPSGINEFVDEYEEEQPETDLELSKSEFELSTASHPTLGPGRLVPRQGAVDLNIEQEPFEFDFDFDEYEFEESIDKINPRDERIDVRAKFALQRMRDKRPDMHEDAIRLIKSINSGQLAGIYGDDLAASVRVAKKHGLHRWQLVPKGHDSALVLEPADPITLPPTIIFRGDTPDISKNPNRLDLALQIASRTFELWRTRQINFCDTPVPLDVEPWLGKPVPLPPNVIPTGFCWVPEMAPTCVLLKAHPIDVKGPQSLESELVPPKSSQSAGQPITDVQVMDKAFRESRSSLQVARKALSDLLTGFAREKQGIKLTAFQNRVLISVGRWLKVNTSNTPVARATAAGVVRSAMTLMDGNLGVKASNGQHPMLRRVKGQFHAQIYGNPDLGVDCGKPFFTVDGPNCRRDVITHEFFHFVGVDHGDGPATSPTIRAKITTPQIALNSADNLAQLVSEIMNGRTDACTRVGD
jgi:hypothetical protein